MKLSFRFLRYHKATVLSADPVARMGESTEQLGLEVFFEQICQIISFDQQQLNQTETHEADAKKLLLLMCDL